MGPEFDDLSDVKQFYARLVDEHTAGPKVVGWNTSHSQITGFLQLTCIDGFGSGVSVLDLGCGSGDLVSFLDARGYDVDYTGWDISEELVARARQNHPGRRFDIVDILAEQRPERFDYVVCSGTLNLLLPDHGRWVASMVKAMFELCRRGLAFNLLSAYYADDSPFSVHPGRYFYARPEQVMAMCMELSRQVVVEHYGQAGGLSAFVYRRSLEPMRRLAAALEPGPEYGPAHEPIIELYETHGFYPELLEYLEALEPSAGLYYRMGVVAGHLEDEQRQREAFERSIELDAESATTLLHLAIVHMENERPEAALPLLERAFELEPSDESIQRWLERCRAWA